MRDNIEYQALHIHVHGPRLVSLLHLQDQHNVMALSQHQVQQHLLELPHQHAQIQLMSCSHYVALVPIGPAVQAHHHKICHDLQPQSPLEHRHHRM